MSKIPPKVLDGIEKELSHFIACKAGADCNRCNLFLKDMSAMNPKIKPN